MPHSFPFEKRDLDAGLVSKVLAEHWDDLNGSDPSCCSAFDSHSLGILRYLISAPENVVSVLAGVSSSKRLAAFFSRKTQHIVPIARTIAIMKTGTPISNEGGVAADEARVSCEGSAHNNAERTARTMGAILTVKGLIVTAWLFRGDQKHALL